MALKYNILWNKIFESCVYCHNIMEKEKLIIHNISFYIKHLLKNKNGSIKSSIAEFFPQYISTNVPINYIESLIPTCADFKLSIEKLSKMKTLRLKYSFTFKRF